MPVKIQRFNMPNLHHRTLSRLPPNRKKQPMERIRSKSLRHLQRQPCPAMMQ